MLSAANLELQKPTIYVNSNVRFVLLVKAGFSRCLICGCFSHRVGQYRCQEAALGFPDLANPAVVADGVDQEGTSQKVHTEQADAGSIKMQPQESDARGTAPKQKLKKTNSENVFSGE